jgi:hypothetical protein
VHGEAEALPYAPGLHGENLRDHDRRDRAQPRGEGAGKERRAAVEEKEQFSCGDCFRKGYLNLPLTSWNRKMTTLLNGQEIPPRCQTPFLYVSWVRQYCYKAEGISFHISSRFLEAANRQPP